MEGLSAELEQLCVALRELGDAKSGSVRQQAELLAPYWGDRESLKVIAGALECSESWLRKMSGSGKVLELGFGGEDWAIELLYQVSLWPLAKWPELADLVDLAGLGADGLKHLRVTDERLRLVGKRLVVTDADDPEFEDDVGYDYSPTEEDWARLEETGYHLEGDGTVVRDEVFE